MEDLIVRGVHIAYLGSHDPDEEYETYCGFEIDDSYVELFEPLWKLTYKDEDVFVREGIWCEKNEDGEFEADWSLTWFYMNEDDPTDYLYYESDGVEVSAYNLLRSLDDIFDS